MDLILIVRHGNTFEPGETPLRIGARCDPPLTAEGVAQCIALGHALAAAGLRPDRILCGALRRQRQSAAALFAAPAAGPADWLDEIDHGPDEGQGEAAVRARLGDAALAAWDAHAVPPPGWIVDVPARLAGWQALARHARGITLCVTSNGAARLAALALAARPPCLHLRTGACAAFRRKDRAWRLLWWDRRAGELPPLSGADASDAI